MLLMNGLRGLGDAASCEADPNTLWNDATSTCSSIIDIDACNNNPSTNWDFNVDKCVMTAGGGGGGGGGGGTPWWQSLVTGITQGVVQPGAPKPPMMPIVPVQPWYTTPTGMIGIGVAVIAAIFLLRK